MAENTMQAFRTYTDVAFRSLLSSALFIVMLTSLFVVAEGQARDSEDASPVFSYQLGYPEAYTSSPSAIYVASKEEEDKSGQTENTYLVRQVLKSAAPTKAIALLGRGYNDVGSVGKFLCALKYSELLICNVDSAQPVIHLPFARGERYIGVTTIQENCAVLTVGPASNTATTYLVGAGGLQKQTHVVSSHLSSDVFRHIGYVSLGRAFFKSR
jgi:hypothetical protein